MKGFLKKNISVLLLLGCLSAIGCKKTSTDSGTTPSPVVPPPAVTPVGPDVSYWLTNADKSSLLANQTTLSFGTAANSYANITVDSTQQFQTVDGFGYTLTQASAIVINQMSATDKANLLTELFGSVDNSISISYLRIAIGASDLSSSVYSYDDIASGTTDVSLTQFSLANDLTDVIPLLKQILAINPSIKILATPWSAPLWMKDNNSSVGGNLNPLYYNVYANYFVKYIQAMKAQGITIDAITPQNEPLNPQNNPSMSMSSFQERDFIKNNLGPAFATAAIKTKIIVYDHNLDVTSYPLDILNDAAASAFVDGSAFHLYGGVISGMTTVHNAYPQKNVYFTEQWTSSAGNFGGDLTWHLRNVVIGSMQNWSKVALDWNLANDPSFGPHTPGGCSMCLGALTIQSNVVTRNVAYYIIAHASKFVPAGSVRIASSNSGNIQTAAFLRPDGKKVLLVVNDESAGQVFNIKFNNKWVTATLQKGAVATFVW
jgi:glucosylceramidase